MNAPRVTVATATRNYGKYLEATIESVRRQTFTDWEMVIVDDGSNDSTAMLLMRLAAQEPRLRVVTANGLGISRAKSLGFQLARGQWIACLDGDDVWHPTKLEQQLALADADPELGVIYTGREWIDPQGNLIGTPECPPAPSEMLPTLFQTNPVCYSSAMLRRDVMEHIGLFDPRLELAVDYDLWLRIARHYRFGCVPEPLVQYRTGHGNVSRRVVDRLTINQSNQRQFLDRLGWRNLIPARILRQSWYHSYEALGYLFRGVHLGESMRWYGKALATGRGTVTVFRGILGAIFRWCKRQMIRSPQRAHEPTLAAENLPENR
ncbi:glycosyltransferase family 2 protein [Tuwongella immobilis]|uniref:Glycosyltransferase 2-like domain-containing protein n=1 Tax=Tuwongella immobilis TaxID=692036 RepID=A0A6C2YSL8_9BACT|nr:glycosyltransferase [Tuwongella immobilis]VIP04354.1 Glycosyl transferase family A OS=Tolypothrix bouteillei VB521301 GN=DA73_22165 PE=4 SV=1: Glycos_transf_2 [Tuwongella immobilis]VTS06070.1 Glycosyl transferase family A OS=Tolypothrix bouteillei VB521301 GN=DA73_22165 PE=4 SV=1: Glycos_transf_2 [Tuwongella immobilis]